MRAVVQIIAARTIAIRRGTSKRAGDVPERGLGRSSESVTAMTENQP